MAPRISGRVTLLAGSSTLTGVERRLRSRGVVVRRISLIDQVPVHGAPSLPPPDPTARRNLVVVTSTAAIELYLRRHRSSLRRWTVESTAWGVGPSTVAHLRELGFSRARAAGTAGEAALLRSLGDVEGTFVFHPRSNLAGPGLARELRRRGARVVDRVVYRIQTRGPLSVRSVQGLLRCSALVVGSPSSLQALHRAVPSRSFRAIARTLPCVVLGPRTARAARALGFRRVLVAPDLGEKAFTAFLVARLSDGAGRA